NRNDTSHSRPILGVTLPGNLAQECRIGCIVVEVVLLGCVDDPLDQSVSLEQGELEAAGVHLVYLPSYSPELSRIEPDWNDIKQHHLPVRSFEKVADLKRAVDAALTRKAQQLHQAYAKTTNLRRADT
ncbi:MAG TPA: transposase, partial [Herpetosiphonaceae bacterium]|nr:transposase [Herpetosiphonaceae bacterium]